MIQDGEIIYDDGGASHTGRNILIAVGVLLIFLCCICACIAGLVAALYGPLLGDVLDELNVAAPVALALLAA